jgi:site-specific DNA recombinase
MTMDNQQAENLAYLHTVAGPVAVVDHRDNASGWSEDARRPDWDRLLEGLTAGQYAGVVGWHSDRYTRQPDQLEQLIKACRRGRTQLHTRLGGHHADPTMIRIEMALAARESDIKSERQKLKQGQLAKDGMPHGGRRAYGYNAARTELVAEEAEHIRWAAQAILAGQSMRSVTAELNRRGAVTVSGGQWQASNLGTYLRRPMLAGLRTASVVGDDGKRSAPVVTGEASWPALLDLGTFTALRTLLENPARRVSKSAPRVYLLSGIAICGGAVGTMRGRSNASQNAPASYHCATGKAGCAYRRADKVEAYVTMVMGARLAQLDASGLLVTELDSASEHDQLAAQVAELEETLRGYGRQLVRKEMSPIVFEAAQAETEALVSGLRARMDELAVAQAQPLAVLKGLAGYADAYDRFRALSLERRRAVVSLLATVVIVPSQDRHASKAFDPELVQIAWRN